ncbi:MAG: FAD-dependent oxidoreductase, partial [Anaerovoracaceae bacterium]
MKRFSHMEATSFEEATQKLKSGKQVYPIAGGTDLLGVLKGKLLPEYPEALVNIKKVKDAAQITDDGDTVTIGALTKLCDIEDSELINRELNAIGEAAHSIASPIVRNSATIGGNICQGVRCWYYRYPHTIGGRLVCARKGGEECYAIHGRNVNHSVMGGMKTGVSRCTAECPAGTDIPGYMQKIREGDWKGAAEIILRANPMPMLTARVCPHTCQTVCNQNAYGDAVSIHSAERTLGDYILEHADEFYPAPTRETGKKVAIVGGGPAGLAAAYHLRKEGHGVTIYEKMNEAGGVLMYGIPEYRLPKHYVRDYVKAIAKMGVVFKLDTEVGKTITLEEIKSANDTVFLDTGAWKQPILGLEGEQLTQFGLNFLVEVKAFMTKQIGKDVLVCGGGNVAMDVALTAIRLGAQTVKLICLEERQEMPAIPEEIERAEEEGVQLLCGWGLSKVITNEAGVVSGLEVKKCTTVFDENGRFNPVYDEAEKQVFASDSIILATGQKVDLDFLGDKFKEELKNSRGLVEVGEHKETRTEGVYAGGDLASGPSIAIKAIRDGVIAAKHMADYMGCPMDSREQKPEFVVNDQKHIEVKVAATEEDTPVDQRCLDKEDSKSLTREEAALEAARCMNCGCYSVNASDMSPVLMALGATIETTARSLPAEDFFSKMDASDVLDVG